MVKRTRIDFVRGESFPPSNSYGMVLNFPSRQDASPWGAASAAETEDLLSVWSGSVSLITVST